jgi:hypothetical protein
MQNAHRKASSRVVSLFMNLHAKAAMVIMDLKLVVRGKKLAADSTGR